VLQRDSAVRLNTARSNVCLPERASRKTSSVANGRQCCQSSHPPCSEQQHRYRRYYYRRLDSLSALPSNAVRRSNQSVDEALGSVAQRFDCFHKRIPPPSAYIAAVICQVMYVCGSHLCQDLSPQIAANLVSKLRNLHTQTPRGQYGPVIGKYRNQIANSGVWWLLDSEVRW